MIFDFRALLLLRVPICSSGEDQGGKDAESGKEIVRGRNQEFA